MKFFLIRSRKGFLSIPLAIVISGVIIAGAIVYSVGRSGKAERTAPPVSRENATASLLDVMRPVGSSDHIRGSRKPSVTVVEFSDTECPFCKRFHETMKRIVAEYGKDGGVAWVYRHFPLEQLHSKAPKEAEATECAAELGGNDAFWAYLDKLFEVTPSNDGLDPRELPKIAEAIGLDVGRFENCLASGRHAARVQKEYEEAVNAGGKGTPFSVLIDARGERHEISGAQPYEVLKQFIESLRSGGGR